MAQQEVEQHSDETREAGASGVAPSPWLGALQGVALAALLLAAHALPQLVNS